MRLVLAQGQNNKEMDVSLPQGQNSGDYISSQWKFCFSFI